MIIISRQNVLVEFDLISEKSHTYSNFSKFPIKQNNLDNKKKKKKKGFLRKCGF